MLGVAAFSELPYSVQAVTNVTVDVSGVSATGQVGSVAVQDWADIDPTQDGGYVMISPNQSPGWSEGSIL